MTACWGGIREGFQEEESSKLGPKGWVGVCLTGEKAEGIVWAQASWDMVCLDTVSTLGSQGSDEGKRAGISSHHTLGFHKRISEKKNTWRWKLESLGLGPQGQISREKPGILGRKETLLESYMASDVANPSLILSRSPIQFCRNHWVDRERNFQSLDP